MSNLHFTVGHPGNGAEEILNGRRSLVWTSPVTAKRGDVALFYLGGEGFRGLYAIGEVASDPFRGRPSPDWTESKQAIFAKYRSIVRFSDAISLDEIRRAFPKWKRWSNLSGVRYHTIPEEYRAKLAAWIASRNPATEVRTLLAPWLDGRTAAPQLPEPAIEFRYEGTKVEKTHFKAERSRFNRTLAIKFHGPDLKCMACGFDFAAAYGPRAHGFIEVHHAVQVSKAARVPRAKDFLLLCSNCHSIAHWRLSKPLKLKDLQTMWASGAYAGAFKQRRAAARNPIPRRLAALGSKK